MNCKIFILLLSFIFLCVEECRAISTDRKNATVSIAELWQIDSCGSSQRDSLAVLFVKNKTLMGMTEPQLLKLLGNSNERIVADDVIVWTYLLDGSYDSETQKCGLFTKAFEIFINANTGKVYYYEVVVE